MKKTLFAGLLALATSLTLAAYANPVVYSGQGLIADGFGGYDLQTEICGVANGADVDGPYLLWVLTATGSANADITFSAPAVGNNTSDADFGTHAMTKYGNGTFKYISAWHDPSKLPLNVSASYDGKAKNAQLVVSHGCRPFTHSAWCSPGFWKNATVDAWALTGYSSADFFNATVYPNFYGTALIAAPTLGQTLTDNAYKSGTLTAAPFNMTPFNATGAFLTNNIPGYQFDPAFVQEDDSQTCPIDHFGNFKVQ